MLLYLWSTSLTPGDSGGPLVVMKDDHYILVGVTSWGQLCSTQDTPAAFSDVAKSMKWINKIIGKWKRKPGILLLNYSVLRTNTYTNLLYKQPPKPKSNSKIRGAWYGLILKHLIKLRWDGNYVDRTSTKVLIFCVEATIVENVMKLCPPPRCFSPNHARDALHLLLKKKDRYFC